jgi:hypothetical protein
VSGPSLRKVWQYSCRRLHLEPYFRCPGDGRKRPQIPAKDLLWAQVGGQILRTTTFHGLETLVHSGVASEMCLSRLISEDSFGYFDERLAPGPTRRALANALKRAKRNKTFQGSAWLGLVIDGSGASRTGSRTPVCPLCRPVKDAGGQVIGHHHELAMIGVVADETCLPFDVEPYGPGDSELGAGQRLLVRGVESLGVRYANYVVADAKYATAPFLNEARRLALEAVVRLKANLPDLHRRATVRFNARGPDMTFEHGGRQVEMWDEEGFPPWEDLSWSTVRVIRYRHAQDDGKVVDAYWLTSISREKADTRTLFDLAKSRWSIENLGFNDAKTRHGMEHACRHQANALLICWLILILALVIERLFRLRHSHRGSHPVLTAAELCCRLWTALSRASATPKVVANDTS